MIYFSPFQQIQNRVHAPQVFVKINTVFQMFWLQWKHQVKWNKRCPLQGSTLVAGAFITQSHHAAALVSPFLHPLPPPACILQPQRFQDCPDTPRHWGWFDRGTWFCLSFWKLHFSPGWINTTCRPSHWAPENMGTVVKLKYHLSCCISRNSCFRGLSFSCKG